MPYWLRNGNPIGQKYNTSKRNVQIQVTPHAAVIKKWQYYWPKLDLDVFFLFSIDVFSFWPIGLPFLEKSGMRCNLDLDVSFELPPIIMMAKTIGSYTTQEEMNKKMDQHFGMGQRTTFF